MRFIKEDFLKAKVLGFEFSPFGRAIMYFHYKQPKTKKGFCKVNSSLGTRYEFHWNSRVLTFICPIRDEKVIDELNTIEIQ